MTLKNKTADEKVLNGNDNLRLDYEQTCQQIRILTDVRFKLLAFVPTLTGVAVALLEKSVTAQIALAVSLLGLLVTLGIVIYDLRNTTIYDASIHRAKWLEVKLGLPVLTRQMLSQEKQELLGGLFNERPSRKNLPKLFNKLELWHDLALALVYGVSFGGWAFILFYSVLTLLKELTTLSTLVNSLAATSLAAIAAVLFYQGLMRLLKRLQGKQPKPTEEMKDEAKAAMDRLRHTRSEPPQ